MTAKLFHSRTYHAEHALGRVYCRQIVLLYCAQGFCRRCIAGENHERATFVEQISDSLKGETVYNIKRSCAVWSTCVVAEIYVVMLWKRLTYFVENRKAAVSGVKDADGAFLFADHAYA